MVLLHGCPDTGAGNSEDEGHRAGYARPVLVEVLMAVLDQTSPNSPVHLVGADWGSIQGGRR